MTEWIVSSSILIVFVSLLRPALRERISLRVRYALWLLVLIRLLVPVSFGSSEISVLRVLDTPELSTTVQALSSGGAQLISPASPTPVPTTTPTLTLLPPGTPVPTPQINLNPNSVDPLSLLWIPYVLGAAVTAAALLISNLRFARTLRRSRRAADVISPLPVYLSGALDTPCLFGFLRPAVYLTEEAAAPDTVQFAVAHELTHYRHGDHIFSALRGVCLALH